jgi:hypothetical protein
MLEVEGGAEFSVLRGIRGSNESLRGRIELSENRMRVEGMVRGVG